MGRNRGKREATSRPEKGSTLRERLEDPFQGEKLEAYPFAEKEPSKPVFSDRLRRFWDSGGGKILLAVVCCIGILVGAVAVALRMWVKPPTLPGNNEEGPQLIEPIADEEGETLEPQGPTDDELYPDDGYNGDMPTVSGNRKEGVYTFLLVEIGRAHV